MKEKYYLIEVTEHSAINDSMHDQISRGYFTNVIKTSKYKVVGYDHNPEYDRVTRYKVKRACENRIKQLEADNYGGDSFSVYYDFKLIEMELEPLIVTDKEIIPKVIKEEMKDRLSKLLIKGIKDELFILEQEYDENSKDYKLREDTLYDLGANMLRSIGRDK